MTKITWLEETASTNDEAKAIAQKNDKEAQGQGQGQGQWIAAETQTAGRGRGDRKWHSPKGNLYASWVGALNCPIGQKAQLSFSASLAVAQTTEHYLPNARLSLKWPNDVLIEGKKFCGILLEIAREWLIIGIGVNLAEAPKEALYPAAALGADISPKDFLQKLAENFDALKDTWQEEGFNSTRTLWLARAHGLGEEIKVRLPKQELTGKFKGINERGALELVREQKTIIVEAGDVFFD